MCAHGACVAGVYVQVFLTQGHCEYWTASMRTTMEVTRATRRVCIDYIYSTSHVCTLDIYIECVHDMC